ncbi:NUDIX domain-containing protein [Candidatus Pantoea persica]|uniref:NUDIX domain-containing protein n=1 Tax=Candidatus Pantoea persica TaxID=2518128 RepID=UPI00215D8FCF|nr:NUDIX domain-containing protein [Candidatus Pantoea persica]
MIERLVPHEIIDSLDKYDRIVVGGIISIVGKESAFLFLKRSPHEFMPNSWEIPSGGIKDGESMLQALKREIKEETSLEVSDVRNFVSAVEYIANNKKCLQLSFTVFCNGKIKLSEEHSDYALSKIDDFVYNLDNFMMKVLQAA